MTQQLQTLIDNAWENRASMSPAAAPKDVVDAVEHVIAELNTGKLRVAKLRRWLYDPRTLR